MPRQQKGFFGIGAPSLRVLATLLFDSRGLLTISPVLIMGAVGTVLLYKRGKRAEALTITGICAASCATTRATTCPSAAASWARASSTRCCRSWRSRSRSRSSASPDRRSRSPAISITTTVIATITHPLVGYENETVIWMRYLSKALFQPTIASAYGLGRGWGGIWPFLLAAGGAVRAAAWATPRLRLSSGRARRGGVLALVAWALFAALAPTLLGIDHAGLASIYNAGDHTAFNLALHSGRTYPLRTLAPIAAAAGLLGAGRDAAAAQRARAARPRRTTRAPRRAEHARRRRDQPARGRSVPGDLDVAFRRVQRLADDHVAGARLFVRVHQPGVEARASWCRRSSRRCTGA